jgi:hypothetical protein
VSPAVEDYRRVVDAFAARMEEELGDDLRSIILTGSMGRNQVVPGKSDLLDAVVVLRRGTLEDRERHERSLRAIVDSCQLVASSGLPFGHPCFFWEEGELADQDGLFMLGTVSPRSSRILAGVDVRPELSPGADAEAAARCVFFALSQRFMYPLSVFLDVPELPESQQATLFQRLVNMSKGLPLLVCAALGSPAEEALAPGKVRQILPDVDFGVLDEILAIRRGERPLPGMEGLRSLLRRALELGERIQDEVLASGTSPWRDLLASAPEAPA